MAIKIFTIPFNKAKQAFEEKDMQEKLIEAIYAKQRPGLLYKINIYVEKIRVLLRIAWRRQFIGEKQFELHAKSPK